MGNIIYRDVHAYKQGKRMGTRVVIQLCVPYSYPKEVCVVKVVTENLQDGGVIVSEVLESKFPINISFCCSS